MTTDHSVPLDARKSRRFTLKVSIAPLHPAGTVIIGAYAYVLDVHGTPSCVTTATDKTVRVEWKEGTHSTHTSHLPHYGAHSNLNPKVTVKALAPKRTNKRTQAMNCAALPSTYSGSSNFYLLANGQRLLYGTLTPPVRRQLPFSPLVEERELANGPTADDCFMSCLASLQNTAAFFFSTSPDGCWCSRSNVLMYDASSTVRSEVVYPDRHSVSGHS